MGKLDADIAGRATDRERAAYKKRIAQLEGVVEEQQAAIEALRKQSFRIPLGRKPSGKRQSSFVRVIVGDSHGAHIDPAAANAFLEDLEELKPLEVIHLGDGLDCGGWLAQHHVLGFVPETTYSYEDDVAATNQFLDEIQKRAPKSRFWYIEGNHEARLAKQIIKMTLGNTRDCEMMMRLWGCKAVLGLEQRKIDYVGRGETRDELRVTGTIRLGKCHFTHGTNCGINATYRTLQQFKANVVHGHVHRISCATVQSVGEQTLGAWSFGCLCEFKPLYYDTRVTDWSHGYGIQFVEPNGEFTTWAVPVIEGKSRLRMLLNRK